MEEAQPKQRARTTKGQALSARERLFCHEMVRQHGNATQAAIAAGYSERCASQIAYRLLRKVQVSELVGTLNAKALQKVDAKAQEVLDELRHVGLARLSRVVRIHPESPGSVSIRPIEEWEEHEKAALSDLEVEKIFEGNGEERTHVGDMLKLKMRGKLDALGLLAKHHKLVSDKVEVEHQGKVMLVQDPYAVPPEGK